MRVAINLLTDDPANPSGAHWFWTRVIPEMASRLTDGEELIVRDESSAFAEALCDLLSDRTLRRKLAAQARQTVEARFSWSAIAETAWQSYLSLMQTRP